MRNTREAGAPQNNYSFIGNTASIAKLRAERGLIILGMHRSGTSAVAGELSRLGARFHSDLLPADDSNPLGYFESEAVRTINDAIMQFLFGGWDSLIGEQDAVDEKVLENAYLTELTDRFERDIFQMERTDYLYCIKDPRLSRLLFLFDPIFSRHFRRLSYLLVLRKPDEVCASLQKRDHMGHRVAAILWLRHIWEPIRYCARHGIALNVVDFDRALSNPGLVAAAAGIERSPIDKSEPFIRPALRRNLIERQTPGLEIDALNTLIFETVREHADISAFSNSDDFRKIDAAVSAIEEKLKPNSLQREVYGIETIEQRRGRAEALLRNIESSRELWKRVHVAEAGLEASKIDLRTSREAANMQIQALKADADRANAKVKALTSELNSAKAQIQSLKADAERVNADIATLRSETDRVNGQLVIIRAGHNALEIYQSKEAQHVLDRLGTSVSMTNLLSRELSAIQEQVGEIKKANTVLERRLRDFESRWYYRALNSIGKS